jgi:ATP-dependent Clp protease adapter protein ClpS
MQNFNKKKGLLDIVNNPIAKLVSRVTAPFRVHNLVIFSDDFNEGNWVADRLVEALGITEDEAREMVMDAHMSRSTVVFSGSRKECSQHLVTLRKFGADTRFFDEAEPLSLKVYVA